MANSNVSIKGGVDRTHSDGYIKILAAPTRSGKGVSIVFQQIIEQMEKPGYNKEEPVVLWKGKNIPEVF